MTIDRTLSSTEIYCEKIYDMNQSQSEPTFFVF